MQSLAALVIEFFSRLNQSGARYVVIRNYHQFPHHIGNDIDILLSVEDSYKAIKLTTSFLKENNLAVNETLLQSNGVLVKTETHTGELFAIHFQFWISLEFTLLHKQVRGLSFKILYDALKVKKYSTQGCEFFIASDSDRLILLLRQWLFRRKESYSVEILNLMESAEVQELLQKSQLGDISDVCTIFESDIKVEHFMRRLIASHWKKQSQFRNYYRAFSVSFKIKYMRPLGPMIYITGPDGAGKTSSSSVICDVLSKRQISYKHVYSVKRNIIKHAFMMTMHKLTGNDKTNTFHEISDRKFRYVMTEDITDRDNGSLFWKVRKVTTLSISIFDVFVNFIPVLYFRKKYEIVIVETSPYDIFVKYHMPEFVFMESVFSPLFPKASMGILLMADAERIAERKHELTANEITSYYERLDRLFKRAGVSDDFHTVRTDTDLDETRKKLNSLLDQLLS